MWLFLTLGCAKRTQPIDAIPQQTRLAPKVSQFQLGPGDRIMIRVWRHEDLDMEVVIAPDGSITYPLVGRIEVQGMTYTELVDALTGAISTYYDQPQVSVNIIETLNQKVVILGEVTTPGVIHIDNDLSIIEAISVAGGFSSTSKTRNVLLVRGSVDEPELFTVDVDRIFNKGDMSQMVYLQRGDIIVVPTKTITNVSRYFREVQSILAPFLAGSAIYRNMQSPGAQGTSSILAE